MYSLRNTPWHFTFPMLSIPWSAFQSFLTGCRIRPSILVSNTLGLIFYSTASKLLPGSLWASVSSAINGNDNYSPYHRICWEDYMRENHYKTLSMEPGKEESWINIIMSLGTCTICILCVSSEESSLETRCATVLLETDHIHTFCQAFAKILEFQKKRTCSA